MRLTILNVAYPFAPVGPDAVGGAEQILTQLDEALTQAGHRSVVLACEGSSAKGALVSVPRPTGVFDDTLIGKTHDQYRRSIQNCIEEWPLDLIHLHGVDFYDYLLPDAVPVLVTLHLPPHWYPSKIFRLERPQTYLHCVSASQRRACPACPKLLPEIENGVLVSNCDRLQAKRNLVVSIGRICPEKGFHIALNAAKRANIPMMLAGQVFPYESHEKYFQSEILPRLGSTRQFIGPVGPNEKQNLLGSARCVLVPSLVPETSSLVAMEALASGTPVVAFPAGALADIVEHGKTGFLVHDEHEMSQAIEASRELNSEVCRQAARERFAQGAMIGKYLALYKRLAKRLETARPGSGPKEVCPRAG